MMMNKKGFTLVELMVVLAILGLLAGIGIPQYLKTLQNAKIGADNATAAAVESALRAYLAECGKTTADLTADTAVSAVSFKSLLTGATETFAVYFGTLPTSQVDATQVLEWTGTKVAFVAP